MNYLYLDIETIPLDLKNYFEKDEEEKLKLLNPIDSRIIAIGVKQNNTPSTIFMHEDEKKILEEFWAYFKSFKTKNPVFRVVGFNIKSFDLSFLISRSFMNKVKISHFSLKEVFDLRDYLTCFRYGKSRGSLKDFGHSIGVSLMENIDGGMVPELYF